MRYSIDGAYPAPLPTSYISNDGRSFTAEEIIPAMVADGKIVITAPVEPVPAWYQYLTWDGADWSLVYYPLERVRKDGLDQINQQREAVLYSDAPIQTVVSGQTIPVDMRNETDERNLNNLATAAQSDPTGTFGFVDADNVSHALTSSEMQSMSIQVFQRGQAIFATGQVAKEQIRAATTVLEIVGIVSNVTWP